MKRKLILYFILSILILPTYLLQPLTVNAHPDVGNFHIMTANAPDVSAERFDEEFAKRRESMWHGQGETLMEISRATGINAAWFAAKMIGEVGWDHGPRAMVRQSNNPGNIRGEGPAGTHISSSGAEWAKFDTFEEGLVGAAELLVRYMEEHELYHVKEILERYAPESDNNDHSKMLNIMYHAGNAFGQDLTQDGPISSGTGEYSGSLSNRGNVGDTIEPLFELGTVDFAWMSEYTLGIQDEEPMGATWVVGFTRFSTHIFRHSQVIVAFMTVALIGYMMMSIALVLIGYNGLFGTNQAVKKASDVFIGQGIEYNRAGLFELFRRTIINLFIVAIVISGVYVLGFTAFYSFLLMF